MRKLKILSLVLTMILLLSCGGQTVEVIDLNKALDVTVATLDQMNASRSGVEVQSTDKQAKEIFLKEFNTKYAENLNNAKLTQNPLGTTVNPDGSVTAFNDPNKNMSLDVAEQKLFMIEIDAERNRLIATDLQNGYRRDQGFSMAGLAAGMLIGHLLSRQRGAGIGGNRFNNMSMSPKNYHESAVNQTKSNARARSGSGSFSRGK